MSPLSAGYVPSWPSMRPATLSPITSTCRYSTETIPPCHQPALTSRESGGDRPASQSLRFRENDRRTPMIPPTQREALSFLAEVVDLSSDIRFGQLFAHLGFLGEDQTGRSLGEHRR